LQSDPLVPALRASTTTLNGFLMAAKAAYLAPVTPPPGGLGPPINILYPEVSPVLRRGMVLLSWLCMIIKSQR
jgi:hypothetical protein